MFFAFFARLSSTAFGRIRNPVIANGHGPYPDPFPLSETFSPGHFITLHLSCPSLFEQKKYKNIFRGKPLGTETIISPKKIRGTKKPGRNSREHSITLYFARRGFGGRSESPPFVPYFAYSVLRVSRMTLTRIWPGYSICSSIRLAISLAMTLMPSSVTSSGLTMIRTSRPDWMA